MNHLGILKTEPARLAAYIAAGTSLPGRAQAAPISADPSERSAKLEHERLSG